MKLVLKGKEGGAGEACCGSQENEKGLTFLVFFFVDGRQRKKKVGDFTFEIFDFTYNLRTV